MRDIVTIELPLEEAIYKAALQNFQIDVKKNLIHSDAWDILAFREIYIAEARTLMLELGENYYPDTKYDVYEHIVLKDSE